MKARHARALVLLGALSLVAARRTGHRLTVGRPEPDAEARGPHPGQASDPGPPGGADRERSRIRSPRRPRVLVMSTVFAEGYRRTIERKLHQRFGITDPGVIARPGFTGYIVDALVHTRSCDAVEPAEWRHLTRKPAFETSGLADPAGARRIGKMAEADYVVIPEIRHLETDRILRNVPREGGAQLAFKTRLTSFTRTVNVATGRIVSTNSVAVTKVEPVRRGSSVRVKVMELIEKCLEEAAAKGAAVIADTAHPVGKSSVRSRPAQRSTMTHASREYAPTPPEHR